MSLLDITEMRMLPLLHQWETEWIWLQKSLSHAKVHPFCLKSTCYNNYLREYGRKSIKMKLPINNSNPFFLFQQWIKIILVYWYCRHLLVLAILCMKLYGLIHMNWEMLLRLFFNAIVISNNQFCLLYRRQEICI